MINFRHTILAFSALAVASLTGCNDIDDADRYIEADQVESLRAVLIEDFTGQNCVNCPDAHATMELLVEQYGDAVIPVSIHAGGFGIAATNKRYTGLMQPEGDTYNDAWGINEWPKGVVNRRGGAKNHDQWAQAVREEIATPSALSIVANASCVDDKIDINLQFRPTADINARLQVWILEDGIVARQESNQGRINDYVHNHVYRASVNGVGGEPIALKDNIHSNLSLSCDVRSTDTEKWVPANLSVVAFVYDDSGVIQASHCKVSTPDGNTPAE